MMGPAVALVLGLITAVFGVFLVILSAVVTKYRTRFKAAYGDGEHPELIRARASQSNFLNYTPFFLIMMILLGLRGCPWYWIAILSVAFFIARFIHAYALHIVEAATTPPTFRVRIISMTITFSILVLSAIFLIIPW